MFPHPVGIIYSAALRLRPRLRVERVVDIIDLDDAMNAVFRRAEEGCLYGDFQFVIDTHDIGFLRRGVFACCKLAHDDKGQVFRLYAPHGRRPEENCKHL